MIAPRYMLDTNIIIDAARGRAPRSVERMRVYSVGELAMSAITLGELEQGWQVGKGDRHLARPFPSPVPALPFDEQAAHGDGAVMATSARPPKGACDRLIAGHAHAFGLTVVTSNLSDFGRLALIDVLSWEDA